MNQFVSKHRSSSQSRVSFALAAFLVTVLLCSQAIALQHSHQGDLTHHFDCSICVKQNNNSDFLLPSADVPFAVLATEELASLAPQLVSSTAIVANSRAPPLA